jgi:hypothetical protein
VQIKSQPPFIGGPSSPSPWTSYSQDEDTFVTLASLKEAEALVALEVSSDTMIAAAGTGWRATDSSPGDKLHAL